MTFKDATVRSFNTWSGPVKTHLDPDGVTFWVYDEGFRLEEEALEDDAGHRVFKVLHFPADGGERTAFDVENPNVLCKVRRFEYPRLPHCNGWTCSYVGVERGEALDEDPRVVAAQVIAEVF